MQKTISKGINKTLKAKHAWAKSKYNYDRD